MGETFLSNFLRQTALSTVTLALVAGSMAPTLTVASTTKRSPTRAGRTSSGIRLVSGKSSTTKTTSRKPKAASAVITTKGLTERGAGAAPVSSDRLNGSARSRGSAPARVAGTTKARTSSRPDWVNQLTLSFLTSIDGPSLSSMGDKNAIVNSIADQNFLTLGYRFGDGWSASGTFDFSYSPSANSLALMDPFISVRKTNIISNQKYRLGAQGRIYAAVSPDAVSRNLVSLSRLAVDQSYRQGRWTLGLTTYAQAYFYNQYRSPGSVRMKYLAEPSLSYQASPTFSANLTYDMDMRNRYEQTWLEFGGETTYLIPSVSWSPTHWVSIEPSLILTPGTRVSAETTMVNLSAMFSLL